MHEAVEKGHYQAVLLLINHGADINAQDDGHLTPVSISRAPGYKFPDITRLLNIHASHPIIVNQMAALAGINHPRLGQNIAVQANGSILPPHILRDINKLLHDDAGLHPEA